MSKLNCVIIFNLITSLCLSQEKQIIGSINNANDVAGIYIRNQTSRHNAVTFADGTFKINAKINDTLLITSIVHKPKQIIISEISYNQEKLDIMLEEVVNELDEIQLKEKLTKEERAQIKKVKEDVQDDLSWEVMEFDYEFTQDKYSAIIGNTAHKAFYNGQQQNDGVKLQVIIPAVIKFLKRKDTETLPQLPVEVVRRFLKEKYTKIDLLSYFDIPVKNAEDFIFYLVESGVPDTFLADENQFELTQLITEKALIYNAKAKE